MFGYSIRPFILLIGALFLFIGCTSAPKNKFVGVALIVTHSPNPSKINSSEEFPKPKFPHTWYYETTVRNTSDRELKVIWFEAYTYIQQDQRWVAANILNRTLGNDVFLKWYGDASGNPAEEWIKPGDIRVCNPNWHGGNDPKGYRIKWAYKAIDKFGNDYYSDAIIESVPIK